MGALARKLTGESSRRKKSEKAILAEQQRQFDLTREDFRGFRERGGVAGEALSGFLGLRGEEAEQEAISSFRESPGQVFLRERQERALLRNEAAIGGLGGGNVRTALQEQAFGIASQQLGERKDRLAAVASLGAGVTVQGAQIAQRQGAGITSTRVGFESQRRAQQQADTSAAAGALTAFISDRRLKRNIKRIGTTLGGYAWYEFDYIWGEHSQGVMSDEVPPEFVMQISGYDVVDYGRIF